MEKVILTGANCSGTMFEETNLNGSDLSHTYCAWAVFVNANLKDTNLRHAFFGSDSYSNEFSEDEDEQKSMKTNS